MRPAPSPASAASGKGNTSSEGLALPRGGAKLQAFRLEHVIETPLGELDPGREPEISCLFHVLNDASQRQRAAGAADDVRMHGEGDVTRALSRFRIELVEIGLPRLAPVLRLAVSAMTAADQRAVAKWLPRQLDQQPSVF